MSRDAAGLPLFALGALVAAWSSGDDLDFGRELVVLLLYGAAVVAARAASSTSSGDNSALG